MSPLAKEFAGALARWTLTPLGLFFFAFFLTALLWRRKPKTRLKAFVLLAALLWISAMPLTGKVALDLLGRLAPEPQSLGTVDALIVPAGGAIHDGFGYHASASSLRRVRAALQVATKRPPLLLGIESPLIADWLKPQGFLPGVAYRLETKSIDTKSNIKQACKALADLPEGATIALVTDKFHQPRCLLWARYYGPQWQWITAPVPEATMPPRLPFDLLPGSKGIEYTGGALRELCALARDWLRILIENLHKKYRS